MSPDDAGKHDHSRYFGSGGAVVVCSVALDDKHEFSHASFLYARSAASMVSSAYQLRTWVRWPSSSSSAALNRFAISS